MSQITRGQLKSLVKECLVEILSEGLLRDDSAPRDPTDKNSQNLLHQKSRIPPRSESPALRAVSYGSSNLPNRANNSTSKKISESSIKTHVNSITNDPIMSQIFEDTATTTLQDQIYAERAPGRPSSADIISESSQTLSDDFLSESAKNWSTLAFSESPRNR